MLSARQPITIRFEDADPAGVVFYPRAIALAHAAVEDLLRRSALGWGAWFASPHYAAPLRRADADFFLPMKLSHLLIILMDCSLASVLATASFFLKEHSFQGVTMLIAPRGRTEEPNSRRSARSAAASSPNFKAGSGNKTIV